jgi:hypothetical protein
MIVPKWLAATAVVALLVLATLLWRQTPPARRLALSGPAAAQTAAAPADAPLVAPVSDVTPADREAKRFKRYDKDKDGAISRDEYLAARHKAFAKLDTDHDGKLSFDEYSVKAIGKFSDADVDHNGRLSPEEFATTAVKRKPRTKAVCPPGTTAPAPAEAPDDPQ